MIWDILEPVERRRAILLLFLMVVGMALETMGIGLVIPIMALFTEPESLASYPGMGGVLDALGNPSQAMLAAGVMVGLVGVYLFKTVFLGFLVWYQTRFAFQLQAQFSQRLFKAYLYQPYTFHLQRNSAELIRNAITEVNGFTFSAMIPGMTVLSECLVLIGLGGLLVVVEPVGAVAVFGVLGAASWLFYQLTRSRISSWGESRQHHEGLRIQYLQEGLGGVKEVKVLGRESVILSQYWTHNAASARALQLQHTLQQFPKLWLEMLAVVGMAVLVLTMLAQGNTMASLLPTLGLFAVAAFRLMPSVNRVLGSFQSLRYGLPMIRVLHQELTRAVPASTPSEGAVTRLREVVEFDRVSFTYPGAAEPSLIDLSLGIRRGESVGIIGPSGGGKSTLVDVLLGLLEPGVGAVRVDGVDIQGSMRGWQDQVGYVPQSIFLVDHTLRTNVALGLSEEDIDDAAVWRALHAAQLEDFVGTLPDGLESMVGERGVRMSGGQRQRIGIARALYHDPEVLVMDEATSSLDTPTEREVMEAVYALHGSKTIVIVAHRLSTVEHCDRLFRLESGRVVETDTPGAMLRSAVRT